MNDELHSRNEFYIKQKEVNRDDLKKYMYFIKNTDKEFTSHVNYYVKLMSLFIKYSEGMLYCITKEYFNINFEGNINNIYTDYKIEIVIWYRQIH